MPNRILPLLGFGHIPLYPSDLRPFGTEMGHQGTTLWAIHRNATGQETGRELAHGARGFSFTRGGTKGLIASPGSCRQRLVLVDGPVLAICRAALDTDEQRARTTYASPGGNWTAAASATLTEMLANASPQEVVLAFNTAPDGSCRSADLCRMQLATLRAAQSWTITVEVPPQGGWAEALRLHRQQRRAA